MKWDKPTAPNPYLEGQGLGTPEVRGAPVSSALLSIVWAGFGFQPSPDTIRAVLTDPENNGAPDHDTSDETVQFVLDSLRAYAVTEGLIEPTPKP